MPRTKSYPGSLTRRGDTWRLRLCVGGAYHSFTIAGTKVEAQNFATRKHAELTAEQRRTAAGLPGALRFSELLAEYERYEMPTRSAGTQEAYESSFVSFRQFFGVELRDPLVRDIRRSHVQTFLEWRRTYHIVGDRDVSGHTVARDRRVLHRLFNYGVGKDHCEANPCALVRAPKADPRNPTILSADQLEALLTACASSPMLHLYTLLLAETGARAVSEALALTWDDVDLASGFLTIRSAPGRRTKSGKTRVVPMTARLRTALQAHAARFRLAQRSPFLFTQETTHRSAVAGERVRSFRGAFARAVKRAKLPVGFRPHDLRHRRVTTWLAAGKSPVIVQSAMGHASITTTMGYSHLQAEHLRTLVDEPSPAIGSAASA